MRSRLPWAAIGVLLMAAALRFWQLGEVPPGFQFDEAYNATDAAGVLRGERPIFFPANGGREPLAIYLEAPVLAVLGRDNAPYALRLVSAFVGILTVAVTMTAMGAVLGSRRAGALTAAFMAASFWHIHFSRFGIRAILAPLWTAATLGTWWVAVHSPRRAARIAAAVACGGFMAAAVYSHPSGRLLPIVVILHVAGRALAPGRLARVRADLAVLAVAGVVAAVLFAPLGWHFLAHPELFTAHPSDVSLAAVAAADYGGSLLRAAAANAAAVAGMFQIAGDPSTFHNVPGLPVFDPLAGLLDVLGTGVVLVALAGAGARGRPGGVSPRERAGFVVLWLGVMLIPTLLSDRPPNYSRAMAALPAAMAVPAIGLMWLEQRLAAGRTGVTNNRHAPAVKRLAPAVVGFSAVWAAWYVFVAFPALDQVYDSYDVEIVDAYHVLAARAAKADVFLHPLYAEHATFAFLNADGPVMALDGSETIVIRDRRRPVHVAFPRDVDPSEATSLWEGIDESVAYAVSPNGAPNLLETTRSTRDRIETWQDDIQDGRGDLLMSVYQVGPSAWGDMVPPTNAPLEPAEWSGGTFGTALRLVGVTFGTARAGAPLAVRLVWESLGEFDANLTVFVHLTDNSGRPAGQLDREPGRASFRTSAWRKSDIVIDQYSPVVDPAAVGPLTVEVGWYDGGTGDRLPLVTVATAEGPRPAPAGSSSLVVGRVDLEP